MPNWLNKDNIDFMQVAIIGLGRMGKNIVYYLLDQGVGVVAYNRSRDDIDEVASKGAIPAYSLTEIPHECIENPIVAILFVPSGNPVDEVLFGARGGSTIHERDQTRSLVQKGLVDILPVGSIIIDGGNSFYKDSQRRYAQVKAKGLHFLDMGTSGGLEGARNGACLMIGGDEEVYQQVRPVLEKIAVKDGLAYFGKSGAGHFVKMVHNGIEYALVQAYGEGFEMLEKSSFNLDLAKVAKTYAHGSVIRSWIMDLLARALVKDPHLESFTGHIAGGETGMWTVNTARELGVNTPVIVDSLKARLLSQTSPGFASKVISALRREWGGHSEGKVHQNLEELG